VIYIKISLIFIKIILFAQDIVLRIEIYAFILCASTVFLNQILHHLRAILPGF
jgi:hypothetical protein